MFHLKYSIQKRDPNDPTKWVNLQHTLGEPNHLHGPDADLAVVNNILHSFWAQIDLQVNNTVLTKSTNLYAPTAYMMNTLNYSTDAQNTWLFGQGYHKDNSLYFDTTEETENPGYALRKRRIRNSRID